MDHASGRESYRSFDDGSSASLRARERGRWRVFLALCRKQALGADPASAQRRRFLAIWDRAVARFGELRHPAVGFSEEGELQVSWSFADQRDQTFVLGLPAAGGVDWWFHDRARGIVEGTGDDLDDDLPDAALAHLVAFSLSSIDDGSSAHLRAVERGRWRVFLALCRNQALGADPASAQRRRFLAIWDRAVARFGELRAPVVGLAKDGYLQVSWSLGEQPGDQPDQTFVLGLPAAGGVGWWFHDRARGIVEGTREDLDDDLPDAALAHLVAFSLPVAQSRTDASATARGSNLAARASGNGAGASDDPPRAALYEIWSALRLDPRGACRRASVLYNGIDDSVVLSLIEDEAASPGASACAPGAEGGTVFLHHELGAPGDADVPHLRAWWRRRVKRALERAGWQVEDEAQTDPFGDLRMGRAR